MLAKQILKKNIKASKRGKINQSIAIRSMIEYAAMLQKEIERLRSITGFQ